MSFWARGCCAQLSFTVLVWRRCRAAWACSQALPTACLMGSPCPALQPTWMLCLESEVLNKARVRIYFVLRHQRAKLRWRRLHRHGVGRGTVDKLASKWVLAASTFVSVNAVVSPARQRRLRCPSAPPSWPPCRAARMANTPPTIPDQFRADPGAVRSTYETATSPSNERGS